MPLRNPRSIVRQIILTRSFIPNLVLMNRCKFVSTVFFTAAFSALISPVAEAAIALLSMVTIFLPAMGKLTRNYSSWHEGGIKRAVVLVGLLLFCSILPQVETNTAVFTSPIEDLKNNLHP